MTPVIFAYLWIGLMVSIVVLSPPIAMIIGRYKEKHNPQKTGLFEMGLVFVIIEILCVIFVVLYVLTQWSLQTITHGM